VLDLDTTVPASTVAGDAVSVPDSWGADVLAARAAAEAAEAALASIGQATVAPEPQTVARRTSTGALAVGAPTADEHAVSRQVARATLTGKTTFTPGATSDPTWPRFVATGGPLFTRAQTGLPSILAPMVICTDGLIPDALGRFYAYIGTDHDSAASGEPFAGKGGVALMYADDLAGPWTRHAGPDGELRVYQDTTAGDQTETPYVVYWPDDPDGKPIYMYYGQQGVGINQSTVLAKSATGQPDDFTRVGVVLQGRTPWPGDGQTTYFEPRVVDGTVVGTHLMGGGDNAQLGISRSYDGVNFVTDPRRFGHFSDQVGADNGRRLVLRTMFMWRGQWYAMGTLGPHTSGFLTQPRQPCVVRLTRDKRSIIGAPRVIPDSTIRAGSVLEHDGRLYLLYRSGDAYSDIRLAVAEA